MSPSIERTHGFTLIEVLIAMLLIATALLGTAAMQAYGLKVTQGAQFRAQAVVLGMDLVERIEANNAAAVAGNYVANLPVSTTAPDCASSCSAAEMASYDLDQVQQNLSRQLPDATATISRTGTGPFVYTVQIGWKERRFKPKSTTTSTQEATETFSYTVSRRISDKAAVI